MVDYDIEEEEKANDSAPGTLVPASKAIYALRFVMVLVFSCDRFWIWVTLTRNANRLWKPNTKFDTYRAPCASKSTFSRMFVYFAMVAK